MLRVLILVSACALIPATARADDGGWWEWLQGLSGPKLMGVGTDVHLFCIHDDGTIARCEKWFFTSYDTQYEKIKHQFDVRIGFNWKRADERFTDVGGDTRSLRSLKVMAMYYYRVHPQVNLGFGGGVEPFFGDGFSTTSRGIVAPASIVIAPFPSGNRFAKAFYFRLEESYIASGFTAADFGNSISKFVSSGEWNGSIALGFDFRRQ